MGGHCRVPTSRFDAFRRDVEAAVNDSSTATVTRWLVTLGCAGAAAGLANEASASTPAVIAYTVGGIAASAILTRWRAIARAVKGSRNRDHFRSQVFQHPSAPDLVEFDLFSDCDHELADLRAEVVLPSGRTARTAAASHEPARGRLLDGEYIGIGNYPPNFVDAEPLVDGDYVVVWYAKRLLGSPWVEIGRQPFSVPLPARRMRQGSTGPDRGEPFAIPGLDGP